MAQGVGQAEDSERADAKSEHRVGLDEAQAECDDRADDAETVGGRFQHRAYVSRKV